MRFLHHFFFQCRFLTGLARFLALDAFFDKRRRAGGVSGDGVGKAVVDLGMDDRTPGTFCRDCMTHFLRFLGRLVKLIWFGERFGFWGEVDLMRLNWGRELKGARQGMVLVCSRRFYLM